MQLVVINAIATALGPFQGLPSGGIVKAGVDASTTFELDDEDQLEQALNGGLADAIADGDVSEVYVRATETDLGQRLYIEKMVVGHASLTDADTSQTIDHAVAFPTGATLVGYRRETTTAFAGGAVSALVADIGFDGAGLGDVLEDGQSVMAAAGAVFGAGTNAKPNAYRNIGGQKIRAKFDSTDGNVADLTAGRALIEVFYKML